MSSTGCDVLADSLSAGRPLRRTSTGSRRKGSDGVDPLVPVACGGAGANGRTTTSEEDL